MFLTFLKLDQWSSYLDQNKTLMRKPVMKDWQKSEVIMTSSYSDGDSRLFNQNKTM